MPKTYTVQLEYLIPCYKNVTVVADDPAAAVRAAKAFLDVEGWDDGTLSYDGSSSTYVGGVWEGRQTYTGDDLTPPAAAAERARILSRELGIETAKPEEKAT